MKPKSTLRSFLLAAGNSLLVVSSAYADQNWDGTGVDDFWNTAANWGLDGLPNFANAITFSGTARTTNVNNLNADTTIGGINFTNSTAGQAFSISGARITLGGDITTTASSGAGITDTVSLAMILNANRTITTNTLHNLTLSGIISETGGARNLIKGGAGTLTLSGDNSYTGVTTIGTGAGSIVVAHNNALGTTAGNTTIAANGATSLVVNSGITTAENITITGTTEALGYAAAISGGGTLSGTITLGTGTGDIRMGGVTFSGTITQTGTRILVLNGTTINNAITINGAKLSILNGTSILKGVSGSGIGQTALDQGGVLQLGVTNALNTTNDLNIGTYGSQDGTVDLASYNQTIRGLTSASNGTARKVINSVASTTSTLTVGNGNGTYTFSGTILNNNGTGGTVALVKTGTGTQTLSGANTYSGPTTIGNGILILSNALAMQNSALDTTGSIAGTSSVGLRTTVTTLTLGGLTGNKNFAATGGVFSTTSGGYGSVTALTLNPGTGASHSYAGVIAAGNANMTLTKTGAGTQTLTGVNTYTGHTSVSAGTLKITGAGRLYGPAYNGSAVVTVQTGGVLELDTWAYGTSESLGQLAKEAARIVINNGTIRMNGTTEYGRGVTVLAGGATFEAAAGANWTHGGADLTANVYTGNPSLTFTGAGNGTYGKVFSGSGSLTKSGAGTWTLSVANTYTGATAVNGGRLTIATSGSINTSSGVTIAGGALRYNASTNLATTVNFTSGTLEGTNWNGNLSGLTIGTGQTISPGNSPGTATTGFQTWAGSGSYLFEINNATGGAGADPGWDLLSGSGTLNITATSGSTFNILLTSLTLGNIAGDAVNFSDATSYNWLFADFVNPITGYAADSFFVNTDDFSNTFTGTFGVALGNTIGGGDNTQLYLTYTPVPEPRAALLGGLGLLMLLRRRRP